MVREGQAANQEKRVKRKQKNNSKGATKFIEVYRHEYFCRQSYCFIKIGSNCSVPDLKPALLLPSKLVNSCNNQSKEAPDCSKPRSPPISYLFRCWG